MWINAEALYTDGTGREKKNLGGLARNTGFVPLGLYSFPVQTGHHLSKLLQRRFQVLDNLLRDNVGIGEVIGIFEQFVLEPEDFDILSKVCYIS